MEIVEFPLGFRLVSNALFNEQLEPFSNVLITNDMCVTILARVD